MNEWMWIWLRFVVQSDTYYHCVRIDMRSPLGGWCPARPYRHAYLRRWAHRLIFLSRMLWSVMLERQHRAQSFSRVGVYCVGLRAILTVRHVLGERPRRVWCDNVTKSILDFDSEFVIDEWGSMLQIISIFAQLFSGIVNKIIAPSV